MSLGLPAAICSLGLAWSVGAAESSRGVAPAPSPQTKVSYSDAYGRSGQQPELTTNDLPRFPPLEPAQAPASFQIKKGFHLELAAGEPEVVSPVTMAFDEFGRLYVVEMIDYSERREETPHAGRVRRLEDTDGDGRFEKSTVFADDLPWPTALGCSRGGVFVGATPDVIWLKDTNGDGRADERRVVFTGFGDGTARLNVQALLNSFNWGLDNRLHGATGPIGGRVRRADAPVAAPPLDLRGQDFSFDPLTLELRPEAGGGQYGLSFDSAGRKFVCSNSDHLQMILFDPRYGARQPALAMPAPRISIAADGPAAEVFRISPDEPWRIVRTRWRISGVVPGMVEGGGRVSGYFTGATGATIYRGDAYGPGYVDNAFVGDAGGNLVHRKVLSPDGVGLVARRPADEQNVEFLASRDTWFRPVHFQNGPDGCLYVVDMYREVIEHPWSLPEAIKKHLDLNSGNDRGRIWRIVPDGFQRPRRPAPGTLDTAGLVASLASSNGWTRETAARLLYERQDRTAIPGLERLLKASPFGLARLHALHALHGLRALHDARHLLPALADADERVREDAVRLSEDALASPAATGRAAVLVHPLMTLANDPSPRVRFQLALTLGTLPSSALTSAPAPVTALIQLARRDAGDTWMQLAILSSLTAGAGMAFAELSRDPTFRDSRGGAEFLGRLAGLIGARNQAAEVNSVLAQAAPASASAPAGSASLVTAMLEGAKRAGVSPAQLDRTGQLRGIFAAAADTAANPQAEERARIDAVQLLAVTSFAESSRALVPLLTAPGTERLQLAALHALARFNVPEVTAAFLQAWPSWPARVRSEALPALTSRPDRALPLLQAIQSGAVTAADLPAATITALRGAKDASVATLARRVFPPEPTAAAELKRFQPALTLPGDAGRGRAVYLERCASCHRVGADGTALGPDLVTVRTAGREKLLTSILQPNAEVAPQFIAFQVETRDGESYSALIAAETPSNVTLRMGSGREVTLPRSQVMGMTSSGQSLMPEGLGAGLTVETMADLLEFVSTAAAPTLKVSPPVQ